ncbi:ParA family protein [Vibrio sp. Hal054]|uniref:ParA family protein n=1 Tax=Vibrio sp. Hal054 TaxID=3035158 RepID=UPI00301C7368
MNANDTLDLMESLGSTALDVLQRRRQLRNKLPRSFNRTEAGRYLKCDERTIEKVASELGIDWKQDKDLGIPWNLYINQMYAIRDALPPSTILKVNHKKFVRSPEQKLQVITVQNQKGGVGKTMSVVTLSTGLAVEYHQQYRILIIDMDGQSTLSSYHPSLDNVERKTIGELISMNPNDPEFVKSVRNSICDTITPNLKIIRSDQVDRNIESVFHSLNAKGQLQDPYTRLSRVIDAIADDFDIVFIDTPPSFGFGSINAYMAGTSVLFPLGANENDTDATYQYMTFIPDMYASLMGAGHQGYDFVKMLITNNTNSDTALEYIGELQNHFGPLLMANKFNHSEAVRRCSSDKYSIYEVSASSYKGPRKTFDQAKLNADAFVGELHAHIQQVWNKG